VKSTNISNGQASAQLWQGGIKTSGGTKSGSGVAVKTTAGPGRVDVGIGVKAGDFTKVAVKRARGGHSVVFMLTRKPAPTVTTTPPVTQTTPPVTAPPVTQTTPPQTTTTPPQTTTSPPVTHTSPPQTTTSPPVTHTTPPQTTTHNTPPPPKTTTQVFTVS
jgi:hypothetical protein